MTAEGTGVVTGYSKGGSLWVEHTNIKDPRLYPGAPLTHALILDLVQSGYVVIIEPEGRP
jgi:hypothetical protein